MKPFVLPARLLWRDGRTGELTILALALLIAVTSSSAISLFSDRLQRTMTDQAAEFLAADLVINSHALVPKAWLDKANEYHLRQAQTAEFSSVLIEHDELLLAGIKAVSDNYPLRGHLKTTTSNYTSEQIEQHGPKSGKAWLERRVMSSLSLKVGDPITVGEKKLTIEKIITYEPDKQGDVYSLSPRVMMNLQDLAATNVIQPGSHAHYFFQFSGDQIALADFKRWVKPQLNTAQRIMDIHEDRPELGSALDRAERYLGLASIVVIIISGVAIAMATRRYSERHLDATAILRCLGCKQNDILRLFLGQFFLLGLFTSLLGCFLGWVMQEILFNLLRNLLPQTVAKPGWLAATIGVLTGLTVLFGFALPPLLRLKHVSPARVFRRDLLPLPANAWLVYGLAIGLITLLILRYLEDFKMTATILAVGSAFLVVLGLMVYWLLILARSALPKLPMHWRFGIQGLLRDKWATISQILVFTITLVAMALIYSVRTDLITNWHKQLPDNAPNLFALNLFKEQLPAFQTDLQTQGITGSTFFPVIRGRLTEINGIPVQQIVTKDSQGDQATHRELSLTWTESLPEDNKIIAGNWWDGNAQGQVSVEEKLAESLKLKLGDQILFIVGGQKLTATVSSFRSLRWETMKPNFYMIFSPGTLDTFPGTFLTSFYLPEAKKLLLNQLVKKYPAITVLEVDLILKQFKTILSQLSQAINYLLYFALMAGFTVLFSAIYSTLDKRLYESALLRTMGANRRLLQVAHAIEFGLLGMVSGLISVIICEGLLFALYSHVLRLDYQPNSYLWWALPLIGTISVALTGCWGTRHVISTPPVRILREA